jgi:hypothetical protein
MTINDLSNASASRKSVGYSSSIVVNGYSNLVSGAEAEARKIIEEKYADDWNAAGLIRRMKLQRMMNVEIKKLAADLMPKVSPHSLF